MTVPVTFGIVGKGWRADFFARLAALLPEQLTLVGAAVRRAESVEQDRPRVGRPGVPVAGGADREAAP